MPSSASLSLKDVATLTESTFEDCSLVMAQMSGANCSHCSFLDCEMAKVDLHNAK